MRNLKRNVIGTLLILAVAITITKINKQPETINAVKTKLNYQAYRVDPPLPNVQKNYL